MTVDFNFDDEKVIANVDSAVLSPCRMYRYQLTRRESMWRIEDGIVNFVMLNPSTADETTNDPTINRCLGFCRSLCCGRLIVTNLYAYRATDPRDLWQVTDPIGTNNDQWILRSARSAKYVICAWGNNGQRNGRAAAVMKLLANAKIQTYQLGSLTNLKQPRHPLYLRANLKPTLFSI